MSDAEEDDSVEVVYKPSFVLIAIDTAPSMFVKREDGDFTPFMDCINACYELADSLMFTQNKRSWSPFGVILARSDDSAALVNFNDNVLDSIKSLKSKTEMSEEQLLDTYQRKGGLDLGAFFLLCKKKFKEIQSAFYKRTIIYVTNDDNPTGGDSARRFAALNEAKNFDANEIEFQMVTMRSDFDYKIFYNELFSVMKSVPVETLIEDKEGLVEKLSSLVVIRYHQRRLNFFPFKGDQSRFLKIVQKKFIQDQKLYNNAYVTEQGRPVKKVTKNKPDAPKGFTIKHSQGETMEFDEQENFEMKNNNLQVGYTLIYVSDRVTEIGWVLTDSVLVESDHKEDLPYFDSFWQYCVDKNKVLVCARKLKQLDKVRFVEFVPKFANNSKMFMVKTIPFVTEIKPPPTKLAVDEEKQVTVSDAIDLTNRMIDLLTFDYHPKMFTNPVLAKKRAFLKGKFLEEEIEEVSDVTLDQEAIDERLGEVKEVFKNMFSLEEETGRKRAAPASKTVKKKK